MTGPSTSGRATSRTIWPGWKPAGVSGPVRSPDPAADLPVGAGAGAPLVPPSGGDGAAPAAGGDGTASAAGGDGAAPVADISAPAAATEDQDPAAAIVDMAAASSTPAETTAEATLVTGDTNGPESRTENDQVGGVVRALEDAFANTTMAQPSPKRRRNDDGTSGDEQD